MKYTDKFYKFRLDKKEVKALNGVVVDLPAPLKINYFWNFGSLLGAYLGIQIISGLFLSMHYVSSSEMAFSSVKLIVREIWGGWSIRLIHIVGASGFFFFLILHMGRGMYYFSFKNTRLWMRGVTILLVSMAVAFLGYVLPWGQMSYWGATVITNFFSVIPYIGSRAVLWIWGGFSVDYPTLTRFFRLHFLLPFILLFLVVIHVIFLHEKGSKKPVGVNSEGDKISFFPYFLIKDILGFIIRFLCIILVFFIFPEKFMEYQNYIQSKPLVTPTHIQPEWYFLSAYAVLRAVPKKLGGVIALLMFILILYTLPVLSKKNWISQFKRSLLLELFWWFWVVNFIFLTWVGSRPVEDPFVFCCQIGGIFYFFFYFFLFFLMIFKNFTKYFK